MPQHEFYCNGQDTLIITKPNALVEACYDLSMAEHDLITLAINKLYLQKSVSKQVIITVQEFANANQVSLNYAYRTLKEISQSISDKKLTITLYQDIATKNSENSEKLLVVKPKQTNCLALNSECNWVQQIDYREQTGFITIHFSDLIGFLIDHTGKSYTKYDYLKTLKFGSCSTKRLYELVMKWKDVGSTPTMSVDEWKAFFGNINQYHKVAEFRRRILDYAIGQINAQGDFKITLQPVKLGRSITHFSIQIEVKNLLKLKKTPKNKGSSKLKLLTQKQADMFAKLLANDSSFGSNFAHSGEMMNDFINRISYNLQRDLGQMTQYMPYLVKVGFNEQL